MCDCQEQINDLKLAVAEAQSRADQAFIEALNASSNAAAK